MARDEGLAGFALRLQRIEFLFEPFLGRLAGIDRTPDGSVPPRNFTDEFLASPLFTDAKHPLVVFTLAKEADLGKVYEIFYTFLSMFAHGTATEILAGGVAGTEIRQQLIPALVEAARSLLKCIHVIVVNKVRFDRRTARDELEAILKIPL